MPTTRWPKGYWCPYEVDLVRLDALRSIGKMRDSLGPRGRERKGVRVDTQATDSAGGP